MNSRIASALATLFEKHRIVFWYDAKKELRGEYDAIRLPDVVKVEIANNEYALKYRILREEPKQKFLLYHEGPQPEDLQNWLLDVQLAQGELRTDQVGIWLSELGLGPEFTDLVQDHEEFFRAVKRKDALKRILKADDTAGQIRLKMLAVCTGSEPRIDAIVEQLLNELAFTDDQGECDKLVHRCKLDQWLWQQMKQNYGYDSATPGVRDFVIQLFKDCYFQSFAASPSTPASRLSSDALVFLKRWKDSRLFEKSFEALSEECARVLGVEQDLGKRDFRELMELDYFRLIDKKIISDLVQAVVLSTISNDEVAFWIRQRRQSHWYEEFLHLYEAIHFAAGFIHELNGAKLEMNSLAEGVQNYSRSWYQVDQFYRKFTYHVRMAGQASLMGKLADQIENLYSNNYLLKLGDSFQIFIDKISKWSIVHTFCQKDFFRRRVEPFLKKGNKVCVIISDAMRYEIGEELQGLIRQEDRYSAELEPVLSMLPSYTQLGMAALLPNKTLAVADNETGTVLVNGQSSQGKDNRSKILCQAISQKTTVCKADELMAMKGDDCRALVRDHDVIYVYHNRIDATGDKRETEERVFEAVEETLQELIRLIKKLTGANASNLVVTADHGFIYQNRAIDESDFAGGDVEGEKILFRDRRFVFGKGLIESSSLHKFTSAQLGLEGDVEIQIPKSINRLRLKGSGSRFVHGGASLQEVVIPVIKINKKRQSDVVFVDVEILRGASSIITSGQLTVSIYQTVPVTDKIRPRMLRAGIYTEAGELISDSHDLIFDLRSENPKDRELQKRFVLSSKADKANGQEVILRLEEKHAGTSHYKEYKSLRYTMRRSFTTDFDF